MGLGIHAGATGAPLGRFSPCVAVIPNVGDHARRAQRRNALRIRDVTCTVLRNEPGKGRGYPLVRVYGEDGLVGIGEASPMHPEVTKAAIETQLKPLLVGMDARDLEACYEKMYVTTYKTRGQGTSIAISGVDIALHDLAGRALGVPVYQLLGGRYRAKVRVYASYMSRELDDTAYARAAANA